MRPGAVRVPHTWPPEGTKANRLDADPATVHNLPRSLSSPPTPQPRPSPACCLTASAPSSSDPPSTLRCSRRSPPSRPSGRPTTASRSSPPARPPRGSPKVPRSPSPTRPLPSLSSPDEGRRPHGDLPRAGRRLLPRGDHTRGARARPRHRQTDRPSRVRRHGRTGTGRSGNAPQCVSKAAVAGADATAFITSPATALALATIKQATGSNQPVLGLDATSPTSRSVLGVPLYVSSYVAANTLWSSGRRVLGLRLSAQNDSGSRHSSSGLERP